jgi:hypoxanthine phosphoribosyltransferase
MKTLLSEEQVREGIGRLADEIQKHYQNRPLTLLGVLVGSVVLMTDLIRRLEMPLRVELLQNRNDQNGSGSGPLVIDIDLLTSNVQGRHVLVVDDIFATGRTLWELIPQIDEVGPLSVRSVVLLRKQGRNEVSLKPDFIGFDIPDVFVVGYGLDYRDRFRNLPYLATLDPDELIGEPAK